MLRYSATIAVEAIGVEPDQIHLVDGQHDVAHAEQRGDELWRRVCVITPLRASISTTARSAVEAPVAMLRVYCSWPGVSATMKLRAAVAKIAVGDIDRDALLALRLQAVDQQREIEVAAGGAARPCSRSAVLPAGRRDSVFES